MCARAPTTPQPHPLVKKCKKVGFWLKNVLHPPNWIPKFVSNFLLNPTHSSSALKQTHTRDIYGLQILPKQTSKTVGTKILSYIQKIGD